MAIVNKLDIKIRSTLTGTVGLSEVQSVINVSESTKLTTVPTDAIFTVTGIIAGGAVSYDLAGSLTDPLGNAVTFAKVMAVYVINNGTEDPMTIGGSNNIPMIAAGGAINIAVGSYFMFTDPTGITVTPTTGDLITITGTNDDTFDLVVVGSST
jgi:hypothetical protein